MFYRVTPKMAIQRILNSFNIKETKIKRLKEMKEKALNFGDSKTEELVQKEIDKLNLQQK